MNSRDEHIQKEKRALRKRMRTLRARLLETTRVRAHHAIVARLATAPQMQRASTLALYAALPDEVDVMDLAQWAWARGTRLSLPRVLAPGHMVFLEYTAHTPLLRGALGVLEPPADAPRIEPESLSVVVMPGLAFDVHGHRLGFGQGYYDRALADLVRVQRIAVAYDIQVVDHVPCEPHDLTMHAIFTETRSIDIACS